MKKTAFEFYFDSSLISIENIENEAVHEEILGDLQIKRLQPLYRSRKMDYHDEYNPKAQSLWNKIKYALKGRAFLNLQQKQIIAYSGQSRNHSDGILPEYAMSLMLYAAFNLGSKQHL
jgi:hypothetical protein